MLYKGLKIGVFYEHSSWVEAWFKDFLKEVDNSCVLRVVKNIFSPFVIYLKDGTRIAAYMANDNSRGHVLDKAFVEPSINKEVIDRIIRPMIRHQIVVDAW